jgi:hypothetical protein
MRVRPLLGAVVLATAVLAPPAGAELVILTDASVLKVETYEVAGDDAVLTFAKGGRMRMSMLRVERVVDDEVLPEPEKSAAKLERSAADFPVAFAEDQGPPVSAYGDVIFAAAKKHGLNPELVAAVIRAESAFDPRAVSRKGARGLMQLMPATGRRYGLRPAELFEPERNIDAGVRYLAFLAKRFNGDLPKILAGYNAGEGSVDRYRGVPPYRETQGYVKRILGYLGLSVAVLASTSQYPR